MMHETSGLLSMLMDGAVGGRHRLGFRPRRRDWNRGLGWRVLPASRMSGFPACRT